jgi:23S rRNA pseudouridine2457 synthase
MSFRYLLFFKPYGVLSDATDPEGRPALSDYVPVPGIYAAGRLDADSEGLMLLTDDGALAHRLTDPRYKLPKTYFVQVENVPDAAALTALRRGVPVKGELTAPAEVELLPAEPDLPPRPVPIRDHPTIPTAWLKIVLREGKKRQIRHMTAAVGHPTLRLVRAAIGPLTLHHLEPGQWRDLTAEELAGLQQSPWVETLRVSVH